MTDRELMQQALASLEGYARNCRCEGGGGLCDAGKALKARLAEPEPTMEVTWIDNKQTGNFFNAAPPQREWKGLTDDDINDHWITAMRNTEGTRLPIPEFARAIEAKLKEKNGF